MLFDHLIKTCIFNGNSFKIQWMIKSYYKQILDITMHLREWKNNSERNINSLQFTNENFKVRKKISLKAPV